MEGELLPAASKNQKLFIDWTLDLLIYIVVINLFAQYSSNIYFENFSISILTALVLKILLYLIINLEHKVSIFFKSIENKLSKTLNVIVSLSILFLSKFLILEIIDIIFGEYVEIKGFIPLMVMIILMIVARKTFEKIYNKI